MCLKQQLTLTEEVLLAPYNHTTYLKGFSATDHHKIQHINKLEEKKKRKKKHFVALYLSPPFFKDTTK